MALLKRFAVRWRSEAGYREVLVVAFPLILSTASWSVQHFVDRMFLTWYSPEAVAASMPAGILNFTFMSLFIGTAGYVSTFIAQYHGAGRSDRIGSVLWQGLYVALAGAVLHLVMIPFAGDIFRFVGHEAQVQSYETVYFRILCLGAFPVIASSAMSGFYSGLGRTWPVMWVNVISTGVNILLDYALIFGHWGLPGLGVTGAAIATVAAMVVGFLLYCILIFRESNNRLYAVLKDFRFDRELFGRLMRYGLPNGLQFFLDVSGFTVFLLLMGRLGTTSLAATNIAFNINTLAFMPMIGFGIAVSVLVGQYIGKGRADLAERGVYSGFHMTLFYMSSVAAAYVFLPDLFLWPYAAQSDPVRFREISEMTVILLRFVAVYSVFDTMNIIFASAIKGAGDTRFVVLMVVTLSLGVLVVPTYVAISHMGMGLYVCWGIASAYVILLGFAFLFRFLGGEWKEMKVIEEAPHLLPPSLPEAPLGDREL